MILEAWRGVGGLAGSARTDEDWELVDALQERRLQVEGPKVHSRSGGLQEVRG